MHKSKLGELSRALALVENPVATKKTPATKVVSVIKFEKLPGIVMLQMDLKFQLMRLVVNCML